ncbi:MAG: hypothetical protein KDC38_11185, partial [Planctomycetes bacterium]|nr:hypothetical protein [Planctomycetota bacterium]
MASRNRTRLALLVTGVLTLAGSTFADGILFAPGADDSPLFREQLSLMTDVPVSYVDTRVVTPTAAALASFEMVVTFTDGSTFGNATTWGNRLADFVDAGGSVVMLGSAYRMGGRLTDPGYLPVLSDIGWSSV